MVFHMTAQAAKLETPICKTISKAVEFLLTARETVTRQEGVLRWNLLELVKVRGYGAQKEIAESFGITPTHFADLCSGRRPISDELAGVIAKAVAPPTSRTS